MTVRSKPAKAKRKTATPAKPYEPTPRERDAVAKAREARANAPRVISKMKDGKTEISFDHPDQLYGMALLMDAIGVSDSAIFEGLISQLGNASIDNGEISTNNMNFMLGVMKGIAPKDTVEVMLVAQMAAVQVATMTFARRLAQVDNIAQQDSAERAFNKLARTFTTQVEALKKYRTGGEQRIVVQRVNVTDGGQAIVGSVAPGGRGASKKLETTS